MSLLESMSSLLTPNVVAKASKSLREPLGATERGLAAAWSTVLTAVSTIAAADEGGAIAQLLRDHAARSAVLDNLADVFGGEGITPSIRDSGQPAVDELFGQSAAAVDSALAAFTGIKHSSASSLLIMAVPVVLGVLARYQVRQYLSARHLTRVLAGQRDSLASVLPAGIRSAVGFMPSSENAPGAAGLASQLAPATGHKWGRGRGALSLPLLGLLVVLILGSLLFLPRGFSRRSAAIDPNEAANIRLPDGAVLRVPANAANYNLAAFVESAPPTQVPKTFVLERLDFEAKSAQLTAESEPTIEALIAILRSSPSTAVTLVGHATDSTNVTMNDELALERANSVREILLDEGIDPKRVAAMGYAQNRPLRLSERDAGHAEGRQLELTVIRK